jgi:hypothetical protein
MLPRSAIATPDRRRVNGEIHWIANRTEAMAMATDNSGTLALLIDGDNASPKIVVGLLAEIANYGLASVKRI